MPPPAASASSPKPPAMLLPRLRTALRQFQSSGKAFQLLLDDTTTTTTTTTTTRRCKTLVILDSSFNPPTIAHMRMASSAVAEYRHDDLQDDVRLLLLLAVNNADKAPNTPAPLEHRLLMMRALAGDLARGNTTPTPVDIGLTTRAFFHDKSAAIAAQYYEGGGGGGGALEQVFLAGYDTLIRIFNPKYYNDNDNNDHAGGDETPMQSALGPFLARARLRVSMRTDAEWGGREEQVAFVEGMLRGDELEKVGGRREWAQRVELVEGCDEVGEDGLVLSSTAARAVARKGDWQRLRRLVPPRVADLIEGGEVSW